MPNENSQATYRILDASANRAGEGLRTLEEFARFVLDDSGLTAQLKTLRHDLAAALRQLPRESLLRARDTEADVGTEIGESAEYARAEVAEVVAAASTRTQQSLRVLEEYVKLLDPRIAKAIEQTRYRCYTVCANLELRLLPWDRQQCDRRKRIARSHLYVLVDAAEDEAQFAEMVKRLYLLGVDVLQLRDREHDDRTLIQRARRGTEIARELEKLFIMNDRADLAVAADTDGVHVGQEELPVGVARKIVGPHRLIGVSTHSIAQARDAVAEGADYIGCGPVFAGNTKSFESYVGTGFLSEVSSEIEIPAFAIGGINRTNIDRVVEAGFHRIAVAGAVRDVADQTAAVAELRRAMSC